ncbi:DNA ligase 1-like isoform X2 [Mercenaria mercenaria]|uniref:DNA ligase 1-like isoform X2 n=1 Tax=Mercenaria mercenaria TaxID=6596 RepID=UPI00234E605C|nr:DNA ligase 1-like isoform X2 [Mercenaria mercenaria]
MFKAIGRWGSQVRSSINLRIFSNIFGSKSKKYGDLDNEDEEIFIDAQEEIVHESDTEEERVPPQITEIKSESDDSKRDKVDGNLEVEHNDVKTLETQDIISEQITTQVEVVERKETEEIFNTEQNESNAEQPSSHKEAEKENTSCESSDDNSDTEQEDDDDDDHHINHKDTKQMMKNSKQNNGIAQSASSSSMIQKVHRRMNSYSQRQYAKFDNSQDDENDGEIHSTGDSSHDKVDSHVVDDNLESAQVIKSEKKSKRKKKIAKRTRKAVRGSWKWFRRSMVAYAYTFNFSSMFIVNIASAAKK